MAANHRRLRIVCVACCSATEWLREPTGSAGWRALARGAARSLGNPVRPIARRARVRRTNSIQTAPGRWAERTRAIASAGPTGEPNPGKPGQSAGQGLGSDRSRYISHSRRARKQHRRAATPDSGAAGFIGRRYSTECRQWWRHNPASPPTSTAVAGGLSRARACHLDHDDCGSCPDRPAIASSTGRQVCRTGLRLRP